MRAKRFTWVVVVLNVIFNVGFVLPMFLVLVQEPAEGDEVLLAIALGVLLVTALVSATAVLWHRPWVQKGTRIYIFFYLIMCLLYGLLFALQSWILLVVLFACMYIGIRMVFKSKDLLPLWRLLISINLIISVLVWTFLV